MVQGLILSKALRIHQEKEKKTLTTLQDEVAELHKTLEDKETEAISLREKMPEVKKIKEEVVKMHNADMKKIKEHDKLIKELHTSLEATKDNTTSKDRENQRIMETLEQLQGNSFAIASYVVML
jgi:predicted RNase H-like nuclease (RuvC/YqgF family)